MTPKITTIRTPQTNAAKLRRSDICEAHSVAPGRGKLWVGKEFARKLWRSGMSVSPGVAQQTRGSNLSRKI